MNMSDRFVCTISFCSYNDQFLKFALRSLTAFAQEENFTYELYCKISKETIVICFDIYYFESDPEAIKNLEAMLVGWHKAMIPWFDGFYKNSERGVKNDC